MDDKAKSILIVEDEKPLINALAEKLRAENYTVYRAGNGEEGLKEAHEKKPDLILLDIKMPNLDGINALRIIKKIKPQELRDGNDVWAKSVKVIILTNLKPDEPIISGLSGTDPAYYLLKAEWTISDIVEKIREVLNS